MGRESPHDSLASEHDSIVEYKLNWLAVWQDILLLLLYCDVVVYQTYSIMQRADSLISLHSSTVRNLCYLHLMSQNRIISKYGLSEV